MGSYGLSSSAARPDQGIRRGRRGSCRARGDHPHRAQRLDHPPRGRAYDHDRHHASRRTAAPPPPPPDRHRSRQGSRRRSGQAGAADRDRRAAAAGCAPPHAGGRGAGRRRAAAAATSGAATGGQRNRRRRERERARRRGQRRTSRFTPARLVRKITEPRLPGDRSRPAARAVRPTFRLRVAIQWQQSATAGSSGRAAMPRSTAACVRLATQQLRFRPARDRSRPANRPGHHLSRQLADSAISARRPCASGSRARQPVACRGRRRRRNRRSTSPLGHCRQIGDVERHRARSGTCCSVARLPIELAAEQPLAEPRRILEPDAAAALQPRGLGRRARVSGVSWSQMPCSLGNMNFIRPIELAGPGCWRMRDFHLAGRDRLPVDRHRVDDPRLLGPVGHHFVAPALEIGAPLLERWWARALAR